MTRDDDVTKTTPLLRARDFEDTDTITMPFAERYELLTSLGEGGMGKISLCKDRAIGREVAMKTVHPDYATHAEMRARFVREARVQARLEHPAIVPVYDFGVDRDGSAFFTMKRVRGVTLSEIIEGYRTGDAAVMRAYGRHRLLAAFVQVCLAVGYAHEGGILHRDIKPANVMLGAYGETYVLDWGLAKITDDELVEEERSGPPSRRANETAVGDIIGTPAYAAPEILEAHPADERTDVYALGAILFELLTWEPLHGEGSLDEIIARARGGAEARPSKRAPARDVPPELEAACVLACARDRAHRLSTPRVLADLVEAYLSGDRDVELRRGLAELHLGRAQDALARASMPDAPLADRALALEEAGRAVALAPEDQRARGVLLDLLTKPPATPPREVVDLVEGQAARSHVGLLPRARNAFVFVLLVSIGGVYGLGVRSWWLVFVGLVFFAVSIVINLVAQVRKRSTARSQAAFSASTAIGVGMVSVFFGPLVIVPTLAAAITTSSILQTRRSIRFTIIGMYLVGMVVPALLVLAKMHPVALASAGGLLTTSPAAVYMQPELSIIAVTGFNVMVVVAGALHAARYRDAMHELAIANHLQSWQLAQVTLPSVAPRPPEPSGHRIEVPSRRRSRAG